MNYTEIINDLLANVSNQKWHPSSSRTCFSTLYKGNGIIICYYYNSNPKSVAFYFLNDMGYRTKKGFDVTKEVNSEYYDLIKELHTKLCAKHGLRVA